MEWGPTFVTGTGSIRACLTPILKEHSYLLPQFCVIGTRRGLSILSVPHLGKSSVTRTTFENVLPSPRPSDLDHPLRCPIAVVLTYLLQQRVYPTSVRWLLSADPLFVLPQCVSGTREPRTQVGAPLLSVCSVARSASVRSWGGLHV
jgi:hypothetical protein